MANVITNIISGQFLKDLFVKNWKFVFFIFLLVLIYISLLFGMRETKRNVERNEEIIRELRSEYLGKFTRLQYQSKRGEIEKNLAKERSTIVPPSEPPTIVIIER
ncbi:MAG: hypothetical protein IIY14_04965 [Bacteroidales bacterium]|nr:hypothetical protein [Bacteroidales bacterium]MBQ1280457.1 hypothetical protein [Bacteroidales bacterium]MBR4974631.1 hypothetical protein [Bacteroidales bacterium]